LREILLDLFKLLKMKIICSLFLSVFALSLSSQQNLNPASWSFDINQVGQNDYELLFKADIDENWVIYSMDTPDGGPIPTSINYTSDNVDSQDKAKEMGERKVTMDQMFDMKVIKYSSKQPYILKQKVTVTDTSKPITGYVSYMMCNNEVCLPPRDADFSFTIKTTNPLQISIGGDN